MRTINLVLKREIFNPVYLPYLETDKRYEVFYGGAGSGKSVFVVQKLLYKLLKHPNRKLLVVRKVGKTMRDSVFAEFKACLIKWKLYDHVRINKTEMTIELPNGNAILFKGMDDPEKIKSIQGVTDIWVEEASELSPEDFRQLDIRLRGKTDIPKQIDLSFNPISANHWLKKEFFDQPKENASVLKTTYQDNKFIDDEYAAVLEGLKEKDYTYYMIYALGEWGVLGNLVYTNYVVENISTDPRDYNQVFCGLDFGFNDPTASVRVGWKDGELWVFDELYKRGLTNTDLIRELEPFVPRHEQITADSAEPDRIKEIRRSGFLVYPCKKGHRSVKFGIDWIKRHKIHIHPSCQNLINEIQSYKYREDKDGNVLDEPVDFNNHALDSLRYGCEPLMRQMPDWKHIEAEEAK